MSLIYSIHLCFPVKRLGAALAALSGMALPDEETKVRLPAGHEVAVPFRSNWRNDAVDLIQSGDELRLETKLLFPLDDAIRNGTVHYSTEVVEGVEYAEIGYIYLVIHLGCLFAEFAFTSATRDISRAFVESESIRERFLKLLADGEGVAGWLDQGDFEFRRLEDPSRTVEPGWTGFVFTDEEKRYSVDERTVALTVGLGQAVPEASFPSMCRTAEVVAIARGIHVEKAFQRLPYLADMLEESGCDLNDVLEHCRAAGGHLSSCWVVDRLLGRR